MSTPSPLPDVVVVGGGVIGCATARRLARDGLDVLLVERSVPGAEASSAAAGMIAAQAEAEAADDRLRLALESRSRWPGFATALEEESGVRLGFTRAGLLLPALDEEAAERLRARCAWQQGAGLSAELLDPRAARELEANVSPELLLALHVPDDAHLSAPALARAAHLAARRAGVTVRPSTRVLRVLVEEDRARGVLLDDGTRLEAAHVVVAAGAWSSLVEGTGLPAGAVRPVRGELLAVATPEPLLRRPVFTTGTAYVVPAPDGRTLVGATQEAVGFEKVSTVGGLAHLGRVASRLVPALADAAVVDHWAGFRPRAPDDLPLLGPSPVAGLHFATGHFRGGILLAPVTADLVADALAGRRDPLLEAFDPRRIFERGPATGP